MEQLTISQSLLQQGYDRGKIRIQKTTYLVSKHPSTGLESRHKLGPFKGRLKQGLRTSAILRLARRRDFEYL